MFRREEVPAVIDAIESFRRSLRSHKGVARREFIKQVHRDRFEKLYAGEIKSGQLSTREADTSTVNEFLRVKQSNSTDVADATIRYFRSTGVFTISSDFHRLVVSPQHAREVDRILDEMEFPLVSTWSDVDRFYEYLGNPSLPGLPWETRTELSARASKLGIKRQQIRNLSLPELSETINQAQDAKKQERLAEFAARMKKPETVDEIVATFSRIVARDVIDPPLYLEWNAWRAMVSLNDYSGSHPNFSLDDDLQPFSVAPGNRADIEMEYIGFIILVEVTMSRGARQYDTEGEPVTRHVGRFQMAESQNKSPRPIYGLFIAPVITPATRDYFYVHLKHLANPEFGGFLNIVPLSISQFIDIFGFCKSLPSFSRGILQDLLESVTACKSRTVNGADWESQIPTQIDNWKGRWEASGGGG